MPTMWEIDEGLAPVEPPADSLVGDAMQELRTEVLAASAAGVELPHGAEGAPS